MKIQRTITFNVTEDEMRRFFDEDWWATTNHIGEKEFEELEDTLAEENDYCDEEWNFVGDSKEVITKIWQEELKKAKGPLEKIRLQNLKARLVYYKQQMENDRQFIEELEKEIADAEQASLFYQMFNI